MSFIASRRKRQLSLTNCSGVLSSWAAGFWVLFSPLRRMRDVPTGPEPREPVPGEPVLGEPVLGEPVLGEPLPGGIMLDQAAADAARGEH